MGLLDDLFGDGNEQQPEGIYFKVPEDTKKTKKNLQYKSFKEKNDQIQNERKNKKLPNNEKFTKSQQKYYEDLEKTDYDYEVVDVDYTKTVNSRGEKKPHITGKGEKQFFKLNGLDGLQYSSNYKSKVPIRDKDNKEWVDYVKDKIGSKFAETMVSIGAAYDSQENYYLTYNNCKQLSYFDPYATQNMYIFMTRPSLNLTYQNVITDSLIRAMSVTKEGCMILANLVSPYHIDEYKEMDRLMLGTDLSKQLSEEDLNIFVNIQKQGMNRLGDTPFMPIVTNLSTGISGIKDIIMEKYDYEGDFQGNKQSVAAGMDESQSQGECTIPFTENSNLGITALHLAWMNYIEHLSNGTMEASIANIRGLVLDYMTSIYWFVLGQDGMSIKLYGKLTGVFPLTVPTGSLIPAQGTLTDPKISITYHYNHSEIMKPEILSEFNFQVNRAVQRLNSTEYLRSQATISNKYIRDWFNNKFLLHDNNTKNHDEIDVKQKRFHNGTSAYYQGPHNSWFGHPVATKDGKLIFASIRGDQKTKAFTKNGFAYNTNMER